jgi:hypothetical protein
MTDLCDMQTWAKRKIKASTSNNHGAKPLTHRDSLLHFVLLSVKCFGAHRQAHPARTVSRAGCQCRKQLGGLRGVALLRVPLVCSSRWVWRHPHRWRRLSHRLGGRWAVRCWAIAIAQHNRLLAAGTIWAPANASAGLASADFVGSHVVGVAAACL